MNTRSSRAIRLILLAALMAIIAVIPSAAKYYTADSSATLTAVYSQPVTSGSLQVINGVNEGYYALACYGGGGGGDYGGRGGRIRAVVQLGAGTYYLNPGTVGILYNGGSPGGGDGFPNAGVWGGYGGGGYSYIGTVPAPAANNTAGIIALAGGGGGGAVPKNNGGGQDNGTGPENQWGGRGGDATAAGVEAYGNSSWNTQDGEASDIAGYGEGAGPNHEKWGRAAGGGRTHHFTAGGTPNGGGRINRAIGFSGAGAGLQGGNVSSNGGNLNANYAGGGGGGYRGGGGGGYHHSGSGGSYNGVYNPGGGGGGSSYLGNAVTVVTTLGTSDSFAGVLPAKLGVWVDGQTVPTNAGENGKTVLIYLGPDNPVGKSDNEYIYNW